MERKSVPTGSRWQVPIGRKSVATSQVKWPNLQVSPCPRLRVVADVGFGSWVTIFHIHIHCDSRRFRTVKETKTSA